MASGSVHKLPNGKWQAKWREYPSGPQTSKTLPRKVDATAHLAKVLHELNTGTYVSPGQARVTLEEYAATWLARMDPTWRPGTRELVRASLVKHTMPTLGRRPVASIKRADIEALCAALPLAPSTVRTVHQHIGQVLGAAVEDGLLPRNPATKARLPKAEASKAQPVPPHMVEAVTAALPEWLRVAVPLGVGVGIRQGELSGLTLDRLDMLRRTLRIDQQLTTMPNRQAVLAPTKTPASNRTVPLATFVVDALAAHLAAYPVGPDGFVVTDPRGGPLDYNAFGFQWRRACKAAGATGLRYHHLRHTFASTLLSNGVSVKAVADWMGHADPSITLLTYSHLMPADEGLARRVLDAALAPTAAPLRAVQ